MLKKALPGLDPRHHPHQVWWYTPVVSTLRRGRQEDHKFKVLLSYIENVSPGLCETLFQNKGRKERSGR